MFCQNAKIIDFLPLLILGKMVIVRCWFISLTTFFLKRMSLITHELLVGLTYQSNISNAVLEGK